MALLASECFNSGVDEAAIEDALNLLFGTAWTPVLERAIFDNHKTLLITTIAVGGMVVGTLVKMLLIRSEAARLHKRDA